MVSALTAEGVVREGASSSFFAVIDGRIITHPLDEHILPGVVRDHVIDLAIAAHIRVDERPLREAELFTLGEAFITSTTALLRPVKSIDGTRIGSKLPGPVTKTLYDSYLAFIRRGR